MDNAIRVLVVDDQDLFRAGFTLILSAQPDITVVGEAADGLEAIRLAEELRPDVVLMDVQMPRLDGVRATERICASTESKVVVLTMFDLDEYVYDALRAGASGFLLKDIRREDLAHAVRVVADGDSLLAPSVTRRLIADVTSRRRPPRSELAGRLDELTERERDTLSHLARGLSNAEIAAALVLSEHTVKTHLSNVLTKLQLRDRCRRSCSPTSPASSTPTARRDQGRFTGFGDPHRTSGQPASEGSVQDPFSRSPSR